MSCRCSRSASAWSSASSGGSNRADGRTRRFRVRPPRPREPLPIPPPLSSSASMTATSAASSLDAVALDARDTAGAALASTTTTSSSGDADCCTGLPKRRKRWFRSSSRRVETMGSGTGSGGMGPSGLSSTRSTNDGGDRRLMVSGGVPATITVAAAAAPPADIGAVASSAFLPAALPLADSAACSTEGPTTMRLTRLCDAAGANIGGCGLRRTRQYCEGGTNSCVPLPSPTRVLAFWRNRHRNAVIRATVRWRQGSRDTHVYWCNLQTHTAAAGVNTSST